MLYRVMVATLVFALACGDDGDPMVGDGGMVSPDGGGGGGTTLLDGAPVEVSPLFESGAAPNQLPRNGTLRDWIPTDLAFSPSGQLWVIQRGREVEGFADADECPARAYSDPSFTNHDCGSLFSSFGVITNPEMPGMADLTNGRSRTVIDSNAFHFMRRPGGLAFGAEETTIQPDSPGADDGRGNPLISVPLTFTETFATCIEHLTANPTDNPPFVGPSLWTTDPSILNNTNGIGGNGS
ncbi:MAG: hypothetical protein AAGH15_11950, partial [Myxococcota bacterium]